MALKCTGRRMESSGHGHEHIAELSYVQDGGTKTEKKTRAEMVAYVKKNGDNSVYCPDSKGGAGQWVHVNSNGRVEYVQTFADKKWTDNLLALPTY